MRGVNGPAALNLQKAGEDGVSDTKANFQMTPQSSVTFRIRMTGHQQIENKSLRSEVCLSPPVFCLSWKGTIGHRLAKIRGAVLFPVELLDASVAVGISQPIALNVPVVASVIE